MSRRRTCNVSVTAKECRDNHDKMIRKFMKKVKNSGIIEEYRERTYYVKPSEKKRMARMRAKRLARKEALKQKEALHRLENSR